MSNAFDTATEIAAKHSWFPDIWLFVNGKLLDLSEPSDREVFGILMKHPPTPSKFANR